MSEPEILCERRGAAGRIHLNRPKALNALTLVMVREMRRALDSFARDPGVTRIVVTGEGERAFCAGGDIRRLYEQGRAGELGEALEFWRGEYELDAIVKSYPKPYVSLIDGIVMGGGVGISLHGSHRVAGERYLFAMPEVGIGFFPDVGTTYALPRLPGRAGTYIALTGDRIRQADAADLGLVSHAVASGAVPGIAEALADGAPIEETLARAALDPGPGPLRAVAATIERCFAGESVPAILAALDTDGSDFAVKTAATIRTKSPTSLSLALEQMRRGPDLSFAEAMRLDMRIVSRICLGHDFYEGVRAVIVDKDNAPRWQPASLADVDPAAIEAHFAPLPGAELETA